MKKGKSIKKSLSTPIKESIIDNIPTPEQAEFENKYNGKLPIAKLPKEFTEEQVVIINQTKRTYLLLLISFLVMLGLEIYAFGIQHNTIVKILVVVVSVLYYISVFIMLLIRIIFFGDLSKLRNKIVMTFSDYIMCHFIMSNKRILTKPLVMNSDGKTICYGEGDYIVDEEAIRIDSNGIPHIFYIFGIANALIFDSDKYINEYFDNIESGHPEKNQEMKLDIRYSAKNLRLLKNDKVMEEFHRDRSDLYNKVILFMFLEALVFCGIIFFIVIIMNKTPQVTILQNVTGGV